MYLAGIPVRPELILELARLVDDAELADKFESAYGREVKVLGLDIPERETIIRALEDPPPGLEELRGVLLREHEWRQREGAAKAARDGLRRMNARLGPLVEAQTGGSV